MNNYVVSTHMKHASFKTLMCVTIFGQVNGNWTCHPKTTLANLEKQKFLDCFMSKVTNVVSNESLYLINTFD